MDDLISRSELIDQLEGFKLSLGDIVLCWVVDRVIERVREVPAAVKEVTFTELQAILQKEVTP